MQQPPAEGEELAVGLKVIAVGLLQIVIIMIFEAYRGILKTVGGQGNDAGKVIAATEEIELDPSQEGEEAERV